jgi:hypothetical protein
VVLDFLIVDVVTVASWVAHSTAWPFAIQVVAGIAMVLWRLLRVLHVGMLLLLLLLGRWLLRMGVVILVRGCLQSLLIKGDF